MTQETRTTPSRWQVTTAAPHRLAFLCGLVSLLAASLWWGLHLLARYTGFPLFTLDLTVAPIWAHSFLMLFTVFPTFFLGFLFTTYPRWMNGPLVPRWAYVGAPLLLTAATACWLIGVHASVTLQLVAAGLATAGLTVALVAFLRVLLDAEQVVSHAIVTSAAFAIGVVCTAGFGYGVATASDFVLHFAVRAALWGFLLPVFFAVCHRMIPFFSQGVVPGYLPWRPTLVLAAVVGLAWLRLLLGTAGALESLVVVDGALVILTAACAVRWTSFRSRGNPLLWTLYAGFAWLPVAMLLQALRDGAFVVSGDWALGRAPIHALGMGFFAGMLIAMVTRVTMGHSGRSLAMDRIAFACFVAVQIAALARVASEVVTAPAAIQWLLLGSMVAWLVAFGTWGARNARIYLTPRSDGRPG
ncbi:MAG: NnrS family protein [Steroidobacteraceae bacterium]|nr:NnrS family protein [Steroidobacteraceae bacterium]